MTLGEAACRAWSESHEAHHPGCKLVPWDELSEPDRADWEHAAAAVLMTSALP